MECNPLIQQYVVQPLQAVLGGELLGVDYWILVHDLDEFRPEKPNASGIVAVSLSFSNATLRFSWGWQRGLRNVDTYHHIELLRHSPDCEDSELTGSEHLVRVTASNAPPWRDVLLQRLVAAETYGYGTSPQAVRLVFQPAAVVISTGYSGDAVCIGDGDELLVFDDENWRHQEKCLTEAWTRIL
jgi:hypothetical protein